MTRRFCGGSIAATSPLTMTLKSLLQVKLNIELMALFFRFLLCFTKIYNSLIRDLLET